MSYGHIIIWSHIAAREAGECSLVLWLRREIGFDRISHIELRKMSPKFGLFKTYVEKNI